MLFLVPLFLVLCGANAAEPDRVEVAELGEDATSSFLYFFYSAPHADSIHRVRIVWNGGAQNPPNILDYVIDGDAVHVIESSAKRTQLDVLLRGKKANEEVIREVRYDSSTSNATSTEEYRRDMRNLFHALTLVRKPIKK